MEPVNNHHHHQRLKQHYRFPHPIYIWTAASSLVSSAIVETFSVLLQRPPPRRQQQQQRGWTTERKFTMLTSVVASFLSFLVISMTIAGSIGVFPGSVAASVSSIQGNFTHQRSTASGAKELRILTLGASIQSGSLTKDENGFRQVLRQKLIAQGFTVNMVGNRIGGTMGDNAFTAWPGFRIDQVAQKAELSYSYQPNVILLQCGSNDFFQHWNTAQAPDRLEALIDRIFEAVPNSFVVASTLLPNYSAKYTTLFKTFDDAVTAAVATRAAAGQRIALANFSPGPYSTADIRPPPDGTHPTDAGYAKMGGTWYDVIMANRNLIADPNDNGITQYDTYPDTACTPNFGTGTSSTAVKLGAGITSGTNASDLIGDGVRYCDMLGRKADDYLWVDQDGSITMFGNTHNPPNWDTTYGKIHAGGVAPRERVHLFDMDGDGKCDYVVASETNGTLKWMKNLGLGNGSSSSSFEWAPLVDAFKLDPRHLVQPNCQWGNEGLQFADLDGNGFPDYCCISPNGSVSIFRNEAPMYWNPKGEVKHSEGYNRSSIILADIDGNGRADYLAIDREANTVLAWTNGNNSLRTISDYNFTTTGAVVLKDAGTGNGNGNGVNLTFARLRGFGRADAVYVDRTTAEAGVVFNFCGSADNSTSAASAASASATPTGKKKSGGGGGGVYGALGVVYFGVVGVGQMIF